MSNTTTVWLLTYVSGALMAFVNPVYGVYTYFLDYYAHPPLRWWGKDLPDLRWSLSISLITLLSMFFNNERSTGRSTAPSSQGKWLLMLIVTALVVSPSVAILKTQSWDRAIELAKLGMLYFLIVKTVRTKEQLHYFILVHVIGVSLWGWTAFDNPKRVDGRLYGVGGPDSIRDNGTAAQLLAVLPSIGAVFLEGKLWKKALCLVAAALSVNAFILCNSRGAFLGLIAAGFYALLITRGIFRWKVCLGIVIGAIAFYSLVDQQFIDRQNTIQNYAEDNSASSRLQLWKGGLNLIMDYPLGAGGGGFDALSPVYAAEVVEAYGNERTAHNTYILVASEWGILGLVFFLSFLLSTIQGLHEMRKTPPTSPDQKQMYAISYGIELGLVGLLTAGMFTNRLYAEAVYWLPAIAHVLKNLYLHETEETAHSQHALST
jgi:probable O-glycosylation ligase (exosortase A-associated)